MQRVWQAISGLVQHMRHVGSRSNRLQVTGQGKGQHKMASWQQRQRTGQRWNKGFTKGKGKGMNICEQGQRRWPVTPSFHDVLLLERKKESVHNVPEKKQHSHVNKNTETRATSDPHQQWKVPVKWIQVHTKKDKQEVQARNRFEVLRTDDEEFPVIDEYDDPGLPEAIAKKQHRGGMQDQTCKSRSATTRLNARGEGNEVNLCPLERGKMLGSTEKGEECRLMARPMVIDSGAAETVLPTEWFTGHELKETEESRGGQFYVCAGGRDIPNNGERTLTLSTLDWSSVRNMTFQMTDVTKAFPWVRLKQR